MVDLSSDEARGKVIRELKEPGAERIWYIGDAFRLGMTVREVFELTRIDEWYLIQIEELIKLEEELDVLGLAGMNEHVMRALKRRGFSDERIADVLHVSESEVRKRRHKLGIHPVYKRVDTCAAEFASSTA